MAHQSALIASDIEAYWDEKDFPDGHDFVDYTHAETGAPVLKAFLGLFPDARFATRHGQFRTEQILVLGTDGATETADVDGTEFGRNGVLDYVRTHANETAQEIAAGVYGAARSFGASDEQHDDITSVIVKFTNAAGSLDRTPLPQETLVVG